MGNVKLTAGIALLLYACCCLLPGCGGGKSPISVSGQTPGEFNLVVHDSTLVDGADVGSFDLAVTENTDRATASIAVSDAQGLKALHFSLEYDSTTWAPVAVELTGSLGDASSLIGIDVLNEPGIVHSGHSLVNFTDRSGFSGDAVLARVELARSAGPTDRAVCAVPTTSASIAPLECDWDTNQLSWRYYNHGDYNLDGQVGISDLNPVAEFFGQLVTGAPNSLLAITDGDLDGRITVSDITPIGTNFGNTIAGYFIFTSDDLQNYPTTNTTPNGPGTIQLGQVVFSDLTEVEDERPSGRYMVSNPVPEMYYWIRPTDGTELGTPSNYVVGAENLPPIAAIAAKPWQVEAPGLVNFTAEDSHDADGYIISYCWDYDGDDAWDLGPTIYPTTTYEYTNPGTYNVAVMVTDNVGATTAASMEITVDPPQPRWHVEEVYTVDGTEITQAGAYNSLAVVNGYPAIAFQVSSPVENGLPHIYVTHHSFYIQATSADGSSWGDPIVIRSADSSSQSSGRDIALTAVDGNPAVCDVYNGSVRYIRAGDTNGADWDNTCIESNVIEDITGIMNCQMLDTDNRPVIAYVAYPYRTLYFVSAEDRNGTGWNEPLVLDTKLVYPYSYSQGSVASMSIIDGNPAISYSVYPTYYVNDCDLRYIRATDSAGTTWDDPFTVLTGKYCYATSLIQLENGCPAIAFCYRSFSGSDPEEFFLDYIPATTTDGSLWGNPIKVASNDSLDYVIEAPVMITSDGKPAIAYKNNFATTGDLSFIRAGTNDGSTWSSPETVCSPGDESCISCCEINAMPAISFTNNNKTKLLFAIYY